MELGKVIETKNKEMIKVSLKKAKELKVTIENLKGKRHTLS